MSKEIDIENCILLMPEHYVCGKCLWVGNISVDIDHIDNDLSKPLNYTKAFNTMLKKLDLYPTDKDDE